MLVDIYRRSPAAGPQEAFRKGFVFFPRTETVRNPLTADAVPPAPVRLVSVIGGVAAIIFVIKIITTTIITIAIVINIIIVNTVILLILL